MARPRNTDKALSLALGLKHYDGGECKRGHGTRRYVSTGACVVCMTKGRDQGPQGLADPADELF